MDTPEEANILRYISMPLAGNRGATFLGALENLAAARRLFPDFTSVVWLPESRNGWAKWMAGENTVVKTLDTVTTASAFRALALPYAQVVLIRYPEHRIGAQEQAAVRHWLSTGKAYHTMRGHPLGGGEEPGMAGTLGVRTAAVDIPSVLQSPEMSHPGMFAGDRLYRKHFAPIFTEENHLEHDGETTPFPEYTDGPAGYITQTHD